ncbi:UV-stimulated scaffold protein A [Phytophthora ramorum]|uniref:UV-stimulated scaffold protein A n=1 Tax=Phytophthora ramorum TaxID=164328 RepID=UPI0030A3915A|nr:UV-stimulated scaffold protein A [Phytophthora ramorum]
MHRRHQPANGGLQELNSENEAARFDEALRGYFRDAPPTRKRARGGGTANQPAEIDTEMCLKQLKRLLRDAAVPTQSQYIRRLHAMILHQLKRGTKSPTVFAKAVALCREIFKRSVAFRALIATQTASFFDQLLAAAGEDPRATVSRALRARNRSSTQLTAALALIEAWKQDFGEKYPSLVAGYAVLVERGYVFPHERERQRQERQQQVTTRRHRERVSDAKKQQRDKEMAQFVPEMEQVLLEMNRVFEILVPTLDAFQLSDGEEQESNDAASTEEKQAALQDDNSDVQWEDVATQYSATGDGGEEEDESVEWESVEAEGDSSRDTAVVGGTEEEDIAEDQMDINEIVQAYGLGSSSYHLTIEVSKRICEETADNDALFRNLADGALRMRKRFLPLLDDWEQHSTLAGSSASSSSALQSQRAVLERIRDLRDRMTRALLKWEDLVQGSKQSKRDASARRSVIALPIDAYDPPVKR